jgi:hypothetical protein
MTEQTEVPEVAEAPGEQSARDQAHLAEQQLAEQRGGTSATHNESGVPAAGAPDSGDRNWVTSPPGQQPVLASEALTEAPETMAEPDPSVITEPAVTSSPQDQSAAE